VTPKPLSKERLEHVRNIRRLSSDWLSIDWESIAEELLAAEQFWREAVKNFPNGSAADTEQRCQFCYLSNEHTPDCPWLLAQE
jgi:hypothetical protein